MCLVEGTQVLFIGPGRGSGGKSQVLSLPDLTPLNCKIPVFPGERYYGYVGRSTKDGVVMCGGVNSVYGGINSSCYLLTSSGYQDMPPLTIKRVGAASVVTSLGLWVTGKPGLVVKLQSSPSQSGLGVDFVFPLSQVTSHK